jgi:hypothetical protein
MATLVNLTGFWFGLCPEKKPLPSGWHFEENPEDFLQAVSPDGRRWYWDGQDGLRDEVAPNRCGDLETTVSAVEAHEA